MPERPVAIDGVLLAVALVLAGVSWGQSVYGNGPPIPTDATTVWIPFAETVRSGGVPYVDIWDNKPPLWQLVSVLAATTGHWTLAMTLLLGAGVGVGGIILHRWLRTIQRPGFAEAAAFLFVAGFPLGYGFDMDPRPLALPCIIAAVALVDRRPRAAGAILGVGFLLVQFVVFAVPAMLARTAVETERSVVRDIGRVGVAAGVVVVMGYVPLAIVYSPRALWAAIDATILAAGPYSARTTAGFFDQPIYRSALVASYLGQLLLFYLPAAWTVVRQRRDMPWRIVGLPAMLLGSFLLPLAIRQAGDYLTLTLPWAAMLVVNCLQRYLDGEK